jgi:hypothetical protein
MDYSEVVLSIKKHIKDFEDAMNKRKFLEAVHISRILESEAMKLKKITFDIGGWSE